MKGLPQFHPKDANNRMDREVEKNQETRRGKGWRIPTAINSDQRPANVFEISLM